MIQCIYHSPNLSYNVVLVSDCMENRGTSNSEPWLRFGDTWLCSITTCALCCCIRGFKHAVLGVGWEKATKNSPALQEISVGSPWRAKGSYPEKKYASVWIFSKGGGGVMSKSKLFQEFLCSVHVWTFLPWPLPERQAMVMWPPCWKVAHLLIISLNRQEQTCLQLE